MNNEYIILTDENGQPYIAHASLREYASRAGSAIRGAATRAGSAVRGAATRAATAARGAASRVAGAARTGARYIAKVMGRNNKVRYIYDPAELDAYNRGRDGKSITGENTADRRTGRSEAKPRASTEKRISRAVGKMAVNLGTANKAEELSGRKGEPVTRRKLAGYESDDVRVGAGRNNDHRWFQGVNRRAWSINHSHSFEHRKNSK